MDDAAFDATARPTSVHHHVRDLRDADVDALAQEFADWPKPPDLFRRYAQMATTGERDVLIALVNGRPPGFLTIAWTSLYEPFAAAGIPEIADFNVLAKNRRGGIGRALMDEAERRIAVRSEVAGLGVGLYADYGNAQRMYVKRGYLPDGRGVVLDGLVVAPGTMIALDDSPTLMFTKQLR